MGTTLRSTAYVVREAGRKNDTAATRMSSWLQRQRPTLLSGPPTSTRSTSRSERFASQQKILPCLRGAVPGWLLLDLRLVNLES